MRRRVRRLTGRRVALPLFGAAVAGAACVEIATGPGGVSSVRLVAPPPSIIVGDALRDSTGAVTRLRVVAFGTAGDTLADAPLRFTALPLPNDTTEAARRPALAVDSVTGAVTALGPPFVAARARVAVRLGEALQIVDTLQIVARPTRLTRQLATGDTALGPDSLDITYDCRTPATLLTNRSFSATDPTVVEAFRGRTLGNVVTLPTRVLTGDSAGRSVPVRRYLVRYVIESVNGKPASQIPTVTLPGSARPRPIVGVIARGTSAASAPDNPINFDTTDASGTTAPRLRVVANALGTSTVFPDSVTRVVLRAEARLRPDSAITDPSRTVVILRRQSREATAPSAPFTCSAP